jgi:type I restriction enzyme, S subunit
MSLLPSSWSIKPLGEVAMLQRGFDLPVNQRISGNVPVFAANGQLGTHNLAKVKGPGVVTGRSGTLGEVYFVESDYWPLNTALWVKDFHGNNPKWVARLLKWMRLETYTRGTGVPTLNRNLIHVVPVLVPPLEEQHRIAAILDKADAIRRKRQEAIRLTEELLRAAFLDMFGDFSNMPKVKLKDLAAKRQHALSSGPFGSSLTSAHYVEEGVLVLRGKNITERKLNLSDCKYITEEKAALLDRSAVKPGDVVVIAVGASGMAFPIPNQFPRAIMSQNFNKISPDSSKVDSTYLAYTINSSFVQKQLAQNITDTVRTFLSLTKLKDIFIPLPDIQRQRAFSNFCKQLESTKQQYLDGAEMSENLFKSLLHRAFRGEL